VISKTRVLKGDAQIRYEASKNPNSGELFEFGENRLSFDMKNTHWFDCC